MPKPALEIFREACGLRAPLALECQDASRTNPSAVVCQFDGPFALIGRDPLSDLVLNGPDISRRHAFVQVIDGRVFCIDLDSRTQLFWNGQSEAQTRGWLDSDSTCRIGSFSIRRIGADLSENSSSSFLDPFARCDSDQLEAQSLPRAGLDLPIRIGDGDHLWGIDGRLAMIGRSESCQVRLRDPCVSRFHAVFVRTALGVWIVDLQAREGVLVQGVRVRWAWLEDGDTIRIGQFTSILRYETIPDQICRKDVPLEAGNLDSDSRAPAPAGRVGTSLAVRAANPPPAPTRVSRTPPAVATNVLVPERVSEYDQAGLPASQQIAMWQQQMQMMESFHRDMILMVQMFLAMHREHRVAIREELDRVEKLTRKLGVLQKQLVENEADQSPEADPGKPSRKTGKRQRADRNGNQAAAENTPQLDRGLKKPVPSSTGRAAGDPAAAGAPNPGRENTVRKDPNSSQPDFSPAEFHSQLTQRISELQRERQNYWQRILSAINK